MKSSIKFYRGPSGWEQRCRSKILVGDRLRKRLVSVVAVKFYFIILTFLKSIWV